MDAMPCGIAVAGCLALLQWRRKMVCLELFKPTRDGSAKDLYPTPAEAVLTSCRREFLKSLPLCNF